MKKTVVINGVEYVEENNFNKLCGIIGGILVGLIPVCLLVGCILSTMLP